MKRICTILVLTLTMVYAESNAQRISINVKNAKLVDFLEMVTKQTNYKFFYSDELLVDLNPITIDVKGEDLKQVLNKVLAPQNIDFKIVSNTISLNESSTVKGKTVNVELQNTISGVVKNANGQALVGATISIKGSKTTTTTNDQGQFSIKATTNSTLVVRYVGYATQEIPLAGKSNLSVILVVDDQGIEEVVVSTGYQLLNKQSMTGSVTKIKTEDIKVASMGTLDKMLQGQAAGVAVETASAGFGTAPKIRIRGTASISGVVEPLWVLDGIALEAPLNIAPSELYSGGARNLLASALSGVNPDDIEDITILKDATATALYGTRAVNGVIVIQTKRARKDMPLTVSYNVNSTLSIKPSITDFYVLNSKDQTVLNKEIYDIYQNRLMTYSAETTGAYSKLLYDRNIKSLTDEEFQLKIKELKEVNTDWFDHLYRNSIMQQHSLSLAAGGSNSDTRASVSYYNDPGKMLGEKINRYTLNLTSNYQLGELKVGFMVKYANRDQRNAGIRANPFIYARDASRNMKPYDENGGFEWYKKTFTPFNIIHEIDNNYIDLKSNDLSLQTELNYKLSDRLSLTGLFNIRKVNNTVDEVYTEFSNYAERYRQLGPNDKDGYMLTLLGRNKYLYSDPNDPILPSKTVLPQGGILDKENSNSRYYTTRLQANWKALDNFQGKHDMNILFGGEISSNKQDLAFNRTFGYLSTNNTIVSSPEAVRRQMLGVSLQEDEKRYYNGRDLLAGNTQYFLPFARNTVSYYTNLSYVFDKRYVVDASYRNDGTNVTLNRFTPTWAVGFAWNASNEKFMNDVADKISQVKFRVSYGLRGNDGARGPGLVAYSSNFPMIYPDYNTTYIRISEPENLSLEFEKEHIINAGVDFTLYRFADLTFNYYNRDNFDLIGVRAVGLSSGVKTKEFNWANMRNSGFEFSLNTRPVNLGRDFQFSTMFNIAYNKNTVLKDLTGAQPVIYNVANSRGYPLENKPLNGLYSFQFAGLSDSGKPLYKDSKGELVEAFLTTNIDYNNLEYQGSRDPLYVGGFTPKINYKNLSLSASFVFNLGHVVRLADFYRYGEIESLYRDDINQTADFAYRWTAPGHEQYTNVPKLITEDDLDLYAAKGFFNVSVFETYNRGNQRTVDASFLRFRNLNFQYDLSSFVSKRTKIKTLSLGAEASNIALWTSKRLHGQDPDILLGGLNVPPVRSFTLSLNATF